MAVQEHSGEFEQELTRYQQSAKTARSVKRDSGKRDWMLYTAAAGSACALAPAAEAAVIYSGAQNLMFERTNTTGGTGTLINLNGDGLNDFFVRMAYSNSTASVRAQQVFTSPYTNTIRVQTAGANAKALRLSSSFVNSIDGEGDNIGLLRLANPGQAEGFWPGGNPTSTSGFLGVGFYAVGGDKHYGWIRLGIRNDANGVPDKFTVFDWAYESTPNTPIHIPEPSSLGLLAAGAVGVAASRRRRRDADEMA